MMDTMEDHKRPVTDEELARTLAWATLQTDDATCLKNEMRTPCPLCVAVAALTELSNLRSHNHADRRTKAD